MLQCGLLAGVGKVVAPAIGKYFTEVGILSQKVYLRI